MRFKWFYQRSIITFFSFFSLVRGYNIAVLILAQYLASKYILTVNTSWYDLIFDINLFCIVLASAASTSAGYIINNFYDAAKDQINHPKKYLLEHLISQQSQLTIYLILNLLTIFFASVVSFKAVLFFSSYIFGIWIYSSTIKRLFWLSNIVSALLMLFPFWGITLYFHNFDIVVFYHAGFLFLLILVRDIVKDLENFKGDWVHRYKTLPIVFSIRTTKCIVTLMSLCCIFPIYLLYQKSLGLMHYYLILSIPCILVVIFLLWRAETQEAYLWLHNFLKFWILIGVLSIAFIYKNPF